ncbi:MAG: tetratricopeptide repeat protein [Calditrichaceae bacterium]|nr:tetratricopeptide repeat protein [Calditrichia bacterium]NUQ42268.1 tetratricopeptide repeat protein [Calditrichaceae bacterium]
MLKAKKKYTKRELKQDQFVLATMKAKSFLEDHSRQLVYGVLGVIAAAALVWFYLNSQKSAQKEALSLLSTGQEQIRNGDKENGMATFTEIVERYNGTHAAGEAAFFLAKFYWEDNDFTQAKKYFKAVTDGYAGKNIMTQAAYAGYADCLMGEKNYAEAAKNYEKAATIDPMFPMAADYFYSAAQAYREAGNLQKAKELSDKVIKDYNNPALKNRAEVLLQSLEL